MRASRLTFALETGALNLPETGDIAVLRPQGGDDLSILPRDRVAIEQGFRPDFDAFTAQGYRVEQSLRGPFAAVLVCLPRAKAQARAMLARAVALAMPGGLIIVDGQKTDGVDSALRDLRARTTVSEPVSKAHGKLFTFRAGDDPLTDWAAVPQGIEGGFQTLPGVFSADAPDPASVLLAAALPEKMTGRIADLGAGWGYLARAVLARSGVRELHLIEAEADALACARINVTDPRAQFHWADATTYKSDRGFDAIVCNPPFHTSRDADPALGMAFLTAAARLLAPHGTLWLVANRHLPYGSVLGTLFCDVAEIGASPAFRLTRAARPVRAPR